MSSRVGIVVTCYNYAHYLPTCLDSIQRQTHGDWEAVIVNDGSTDDTDAIVKPWLEDERFRYVKQENSGQARAKNVGVREVRGDYVAFLDADDYWHPTKLERQLRCFENEQTGVVFSRANYVDPDGQVRPTPEQAEYLQPRRGRVTELLLYDNFVPFSSSIVRKECIDRLGVFDEQLRMGIDWDLWLRVSTRYEFDFVPDRLLYYRVGHPGQMSRNLETRQADTDRIFRRFVEAHGEALSPEAIRGSRIYTISCRGRYFEGQDRRKALGLYGKVLRMRPWHLPAYKGIVRTLLGIATRPALPTGNEPEKSGRETDGRVAR